jgi:hypothetical protein
MSEHHWSTLQRSPRKCDAVEFSTIDVALFVTSFSFPVYGTKPGHRVQEYLFVIKSVIGLAELNNTAIALQLYFDRESLADGLNELHKNQVKGKVYR